MSRAAVVGLVLVALARAPASAQDTTAVGPAPINSVVPSALAPAEIDSAIALGRQMKKDAGYYQGRAMAPNGGLLSIPGDNELAYYVVFLQGPLGRVVTASATHTKKYLPYTRDSVTAEMLAPVLTVVITPQSPEWKVNHWFVPARVTHVVLIAKTAKGESPALPVQPAHTEATTTPFTGTGGMELEVGGMVALFDQAQVPAGEFAVVVVTAGLEYRFPVQGKHLAKIR